MDGMDSFPGSVVTLSVLVRVTFDISDVFIVIFLLTIDFVCTLLYQSLFPFTLS